jgi:hypothetical protein
MKTRAWLVIAGATLAAATANAGDAPWLEKYFREPKSAIPDAKMPKLKYSDEEMKVLVDYMLSLK